MYAAIIAEKQEVYQCSAKFNASIRFGAKTENVICHYSEIDGHSFPINNNSNAQDNITILRCDHRRSLTKTIKADGTRISPTTAKYFEHTQEEINSIYGLLPILNSIATDRTACVIRGTMKDGIEQRTRRIKENVNDTPHCWICLDFDSIPMPEHMDPISVSAADFLIRQALPPEFHQATYIVQSSSSAGLKEQVINCHIWFYLDAFRSNDELKAWASVVNQLAIDKALVESGKKAIDVSLFDSVQIHFTADPYFEVPSHDPFRDKPRIYLVKKQQDNVSLEIPDKVSRSNIRRSKSNDNNGDQEIVRDPITGLITDGREGWFLRRRFAECADRENNPENVAAITDIIWQQAEFDLDLSDNKYNKQWLFGKVEYDLAKTGGWRKSKGPGRVSEPYYKIYPRHFDEAQKQLKNHIRGFTANPSLNQALILQADVGTGKTHSVISGIGEYVEKHPNANIEVYLPTTKLAHQFYNDTVNAGLNCFIYRGRTAIRPDDGRLMCHKDKIDTVQKLYSARIGVQENMCLSRDGKQQCEHFNSCPYQAQWAQGVNESGVRIFTHQHLGQPRHKDIPEPDFIVIDEAFWPAMVKVMKFPLTELTLKNESPGPVIGALVEGLRNGEVLGELRRQKISVRDINAAVRSSFVGPKGPLIYPGMSKDDIENALKQAKGVNNVNSLLRAIGREYAAMSVLPPQTGEVDKAWRGVDDCRSELDTFRQANPDGDTSSFATKLDAANEAGTKERDAEFAVPLKRNISHQAWLEEDDMVRLSTLGKIERLNNKVPLLIIDAQADPTILKHYLPDRDIEFHTINLDRPDRRVIQITDKTLGKSFFINDQPEVSGGKNALKKIKKLVNLLPSPFLVMQKAVRIKAADGDASIEFGPGDNLWGVPTAHFNQLKGLNNFTDCLSGVIVGRAEPSMLSLQENRGLFWADPEPLELCKDYITERRGYSGQEISVLVRYHPDPRFDAILKQIREWEVVQAIGRLRYKGDAIGRPIYVLTSVPLPIMVDELITLDQAIPDWLGGDVVILSTPWWMKRFDQPERTAERNVSALRETIACREGPWGGVCQNPANSRDIYISQFGGILANPPPTGNHRMRPETWWERLGYAAVTYNAIDKRGRSGKDTIALVRRGLDAAAAIEAAVGRPVRLRDDGGLPQAAE